ncbi:MAG: ADP-ribosylglycohydrolase family protein [Bryobacteraceae bacterium]
MRFQERVAACFKALATGDAVGKQTETLMRADVLRWYPEGIKGFHGEPGSVIPRYVGKRYEWRIAEITDDTEQTIAVARALLRTGEVRRELVGIELLQCRKSVHPGVQIWAFQQAGDPAGMAVAGDGSGAAMRVAPVGVITCPDELDALVHAAYEASVPTHGGQLAISAAAAVAAAVSAALEGKNAGEVVTTAVSASRLAERFRPATTATPMSTCIETVYSYLAGRARLSADDIAQQYFPDKPTTIIPLAIRLALVTESAEETTLLASNLGGDSDSVASIGGTIAAALFPLSVNEEWFQVVRSVSSVECDEMLMLAGALAQRRRRG